MDYEDYLSMRLIEEDKLKALLRIAESLDSIKTTLSEISTFGVGR